MNESEEVAVAKADEEEVESNFTRLPDEILFHIFNKLLDLKCLCWCSLVSKRFSFIVPHVHAVSFTVPRRKSSSFADHRDDNPNPNNNENISKKLFRFFVNDVVARPLRFFRQIVSPKPVPSSISSFYGDSFRSAVTFLSKFKEIRSLLIELPSSCHGGSSGDGDLLFKWRVKFGTKLEIFSFLSPISIREMNRSTADYGEEVEESELTCDMLKYRVHLAFQCLKDAIVRHRMLLFLIEQHTMLRSIVIADSKKQGKLSVTDIQLVDLRNWINSASATLGPQLKSIEVPVTARQWYLPVLELPVSGNVMEGVTLVVMQMADRHESGGSDGGDAAVLAGTFEEGEEAFGEAVTEIMLKHRSNMKTLL